MYYTHNLRTQLQQWRNRLYRSNDYNFDDNFRFFLSKLQAVKLLQSLLREAVTEYKKDAAILEEITKPIFEGYPRGRSFTNEKDTAAACYQVINYMLAKGHDPNALALNMSWGETNDERRENFLDNFVEPIISYFHDEIDNGNSTLYLLEKYKHRAEWFMKKVLLEKYRRDGSEKVLEDDLRLYLFDQGIDYPFSTTGRTNVAGRFDQHDPLVLEIRVYDAQKSYGKEKIGQGFSQMVKYANDYGKSQGFLVVFNVDDVELNIATNNEIKSYPTTVIFDDKSYFIVVVNLSHDVATSQQGKLEAVAIDEQELFESVS